VQAIDAINLEGVGFNVEIAALAGTPLTGTYTSPEKAGIMQVFMAVYSQNYKNNGASNSSSESLGVGSMSMSNSNSSSNSISGSASSVVAAIAHDVVLRLRRGKAFSPPIGVFNDGS